MQLALGLMSSPDKVFSKREIYQHCDYPLFLHRRSALRNTGTGYPIMVVFTNPIINIVLVQSTITEEVTLITEANTAK